MLKEVIMEGKREYEEGGRCCVKAGMRRREGRKCSWVRRSEEEDKERKSGEENSTRSRKRET